MKFCIYQSYKRDIDFKGVSKIKCKKLDYAECPHQYPCSKLNGKWILNNNADKYCKYFKNKT